MFISKVKSYLIGIETQTASLSGSQNVVSSEAAASAEKLLAMPALGFSLDVLMQKFQGGQHCFHKACREAGTYLGLRATGYLCPLHSGLLFSHQ